MGPVVSRALRAAHRVSVQPAFSRLRGAAIDPVRAQQARLKAALRESIGSSYARDHRITDAASFRQRAPVADYEAMAPWVDRIAAGEHAVLTRSPILAFERSGGSSSGGKLVPHTRALLHEFAEAADAWMADLYEHHPAIRGGSAYWSISPAATRPSRTRGGIPIGLDDDTQYFGALSRVALRSLLAVPPEVARIRDVDAWREETLRRLRGARDLALVSVWSPTFLLRLLDGLDEPPRSLWPRLSLVSCWADGASAAFLPELRRRLGDVAVQPKGLLATEGVVSVPVVDAGGAVAALHAHHLEFLDLDDPAAAPRAPHQLSQGRLYSPLLTTSGGLLRYHLKDVVRCVGRWHAAPVLRFEGRLDHVSDLCGEKVTDGQAAAAIASAWRKLGLAASFAMLAPSLRGGPHYALLIGEEAAKTDPEALADAVDAHLRIAHPYDYARRLGQLGPVRPVLVGDAWRSFERMEAARGARLGDVKARALLATPQWEESFEVLE